MVLNIAEEQNSQTLKASIMISIREMFELLLELTNQTREAQIQYFKTRDEYYLRQAKKFESRIDNMRLEFTERLKLYPKQEQASLF
jgi:hypothetical protein